MRHSKKMLKEMFGSKKDGLSFLKDLQTENKLPPILFVYSDQGEQQIKSFVGWLSLVLENKVHLDHTGSSSIHPEKFNDQCVLLKSVKKVDDALIDEVVKSRKQRIKTVVVSKNRPKVLDYIHDPAFKIVKIDNFDLVEASTEIENLKKAIHKA